VKYAPQEVFEQILEWAVIPTFDLVLEIEGKGYVFVRRKIAPYKGQWSLPGLRMYKGESIDDTIRRIAAQEVGLKVDPEEKVLLGQYVGKFQSEHKRQDLSSGYYLKLPASTKPEVNPDHFSGLKLAKSAPAGTGAMYRYFVDLATRL
jgi:ADP-ribose pyrophosphatase YjhB (NUDIX family)